MVRDKISKRIANPTLSIRYCVIIILFTIMASPQYPHATNISNIDNMENILPVQLFASIGGSMMFGYRVSATYEESGGDMKLPFVGFGSSINYNFALGIQYPIKQHTIYLQYQYQVAESKSVQNGNAYYWERNHNNIMAGYDYMIIPRLNIGGAVGYSLSPDISYYSNFNNLGGVFNTSNLWVFGAKVEYMVFSTLGVSLNYSVYTGSNKHYDASNNSPSFVLHIPANHFLSINLRFIA